jgi:hypothetical protein
MAHLAHESSEDYGIKDVWVDNIEEEMDKIREIVEAYPFVSMVIFTASGTAS